MTCENFNLEEEIINTWKPSYYNDNLRLTVTGKVTIMYSNNEEDIRKYFSAAKQGTETIIQEVKNTQSKLDLLEKKLIFRLKNIN